MTTPIHPRVLVTGAGGFIGHHLHQGLEYTYRWIEKQVSSRRPPWAAAGR